MIPQKLNTEQAALERPGWRAYQDDLKWAADKKRLINKAIKLSTLVIVVLVSAYGMFGGLGGKSFSHLLGDHFSSSHDNTIHARLNYGKLIDKSNARDLLKSISFVNLKNKSFDFFSDGGKFRVDTSLDIELQEFLIKKLDLDNSRYIGIVCMDPATGKVLSMVGFDKTDPSNNPCVDSRFPAASIFKIVTASAVVEKCGFQPGSKLSYNGRKHTLYKSQLKDRRNRYTNRITFRDSFAQSVNPVFGKIGAHYLGKNTLEKYAEAFDFNKNIDFEIEIAPSFVDLSDEPYQWAEVACGFNNKTKISPLHGAMMASAIINQGSIMEPTVVDQIVDEKGKIIYRNRLVMINQAITPKASNILNQLMATTIRSGTGKKAFRGYRKDKILSKLNIGGKTGSIDNKSHDARYDWFVGFAEQKDGPQKIAVSVIVAHEKYIGLRASYYARIAIKKYFLNYFEKTAT
ncbi:MAG: PbpA [Deltaproteobacteria bacterium]|nr:PbpA [Deltaproteobacteria bacterium]